MESYWPRHPRHQNIMAILEDMDSSILDCANALFSGGTACSMLCQEYRRSDDIDILCSSFDDYQKLRCLVTETSLGGILKNEEKFLASKVRTDRYGIRCIVEPEKGMPIKLEIALSDSCRVTGYHDPRFPVAIALPRSLAVMKLFALMDRWSDPAKNSRDFLDFGMLLNSFTLNLDDIIAELPERYLPHVIRGLKGSLVMLRNPKYFRTVSQKLEMPMPLMAQARRTGKQVLEYMLESDGHGDSPRP